MCGCTLPQSSATQGAPHASGSHRSALPGNCTHGTLHKKTLTSLSTATSAWNTPITVQVLIECCHDIPGALPGECEDIAMGGQSSTGKKTCPDAVNDVLWLWVICADAFATNLVPLPASWAIQSGLHIPSCIQRLAPRLMVNSDHLDITQSRCLSSHFLPCGEIVVCDIPQLTMIHTVHQLTMGR